MRRLLVALVACAVFTVCCSRERRAPSDLAEARRIVSVAPAMTEAIFAIGAGDRLVGRSRYCDYPEAASRVPVVGGFLDADLEAILQLRPDLVVGAPGPSSARLSAQLGARGIPTWFPSIRSFAAIDAMIDGLGRRTRHAADARRVVDAVDGETRAVERAVAGEPAPRVLVVLDVGPVVAAGPDDFVDEMVRRARATNVLRTGGPWQTLGFEQIIELDPDVIVDASLVGSARPTTITVQAAGWSDVRAVRQGRVAAIGDVRVVRPGPRVAQGLATLARALHPRAPVPTF